MGRLVLEIRRICYACGLTRTYIDRNGHENWYLNRGTDLVLCMNCNARYILVPAYYKEHKDNFEFRTKRRATALRRITYRGRRILATFNQHTGYCSWCPNNIHDKSCKKTAMLHTLGYFPTLPWFGRIELCVGCHTKESMKSGEIPVHSTKKKE